MFVATLALIVVVALVTVSTFQRGGDVARWSAISTIWIVIPIIIAALIFLVLLGALIYGMAQLLKWIPPYTGYAQRIVWRAQGHIQRGADMVVRPVLGIEGVLATVRSIFGIK